MIVISTIDSYFDLEQVFKTLERLPDVKGFVTHSSGNHGQALAYACKCAGKPCVVVVPRGTAASKTAAIQSYGAELVVCEPTPESRRNTCHEVADRRGYVVIHPYDNYDVMAGQGTIGKELLEDYPDLDAVLVPISGGGMSSGIATAARALNPACKGTFFDFRKLTRSYRNSDLFSLLVLEISSFSTNSCG